MKDEALRFLGLIRRAGKLEAGEDSVRRAIPAGKVRRILLASDASSNAEKRAVSFAARAGVPLIRLDAVKEELAGATGTAGGAVYAVCDEGFSQALEKKLSRSETPDRM